MCALSRISLARMRCLLLGIERLSPEGKLFNRISGVLFLNRDEKYMIVWLVCEAGTG